MVGNGRGRCGVRQRTPRAGFLHSRKIMERMPIDDRPGTTPIITEEEGSITYVLPLGRIAGTPRLVIRCDAAGEVWVSLRTESSD